MREKCGNCRWWKRDRGKGRRRGVCLRYPPALPPLPGKLEGQRPITDRGDGCGEWAAEDAPEGDERPSA